MGTDAELGRCLRGTLTMLSCGPPGMPTPNFDHANPTPNFDHANPTPNFDHAGVPPVPTSTASQPAAEQSSTEQLLTW